MLKLHTLDTVRPNVSDFAHAVEVPSNARWVYTNGQNAVRLDGTFPESIEEQTELVFERIRLILKAANMTLKDLVRLTVYLVDENDSLGYRGVRDRIMADHKASATLIYIKGIKPGLKIEIEAVAAKVDHKDDVAYSTWQH